MRDRLGKLMSRAGLAHEAGSWAGPDSASLPATAANSRTSKSVCAWPSLVTAACLFR